MNKTKGVLTFFLIIVGLTLIPQLTSATHTPTNCGVYFTGVGCPHCAKADPVVLQNTIHENCDMVVIEYEIYQQRNNAYLIDQYHQQYQSGLGIPLLIFNKQQTLLGDQAILGQLSSTVNDLQSNSCPLPSGEKTHFENLDLTSLPGFPKIWRGERILLKKGPQGDSDALKDLLLTQDLSSVLSDIDYEQVSAQKVPLSGQYVYFDQAIQVQDWIFQWNGPSIENLVGQSSPPATSSMSATTPPAEGGEMPKLTWAKVVSLAVVDAVNPCALAVLILMLTAILSYDPRSRKRLLWSGLAFVGAVFIMYLIYGLVIIKFFQLIQALTEIRLWLYKILGGLAIILGILNIRDFWCYSPGTAGTEMPLFLRPKVKKIISKVTSPRGAFLTGLFVTVFLLPCTIGPYIITGGILSGFALLQNLPPLLVYNLVFVLPMLAIVTLVYYGFRQVDDIKKWKSKHITKLHLAAGIIMVLLGLAMILGWV